MRLPSAVRRIRLHPEQKGCVIEEIKETVPAESATLGRLGELGRFGRFGKSGRFGRFGRLLFLFWQV